MNHIIFKMKTCLPALLACTVFLFSCNKDFPVAVPNPPYVPPAGQTILLLLDNANFSILKRAVGRVPALSAQLGNASNVFTAFAPDNASFATIGITSTAQIDGMNLAQLTAILNYHFIGGQSYPSPAISEKFPNMYLQSSLLLSAPSASLPPGYRMPLFVSRRGASMWANALSIKQANVTASNGTVHVPASVLIPPDSVLAQIVAVDPSYAYLMAAIVRADSGAVAPNRIVDALANAAANFTVMAPTNEAFQQTLTFVITQALIAQGMDAATALATATALASTPAVFSNPALYSSLTARTVAGIVAYHVIGRVSASPTNTALVGRIFSVNIPATLTPVNTLVVPAPNVGPVPVFIQNTSGTVTVKGLANPTAATVTVANKNAVNGVIHRINGVLLPQ